MTLFTSQAPLASVCQLAGSRSVPGKLTVVAISDAAGPQNVSADLIGW